MKNAQKSRGKFVRSLLPKPIEYYQKQGIELKGHGAWRDAICPFHKDTKPSLRVNVERGAYRCMVCGARGGDLVDYEQQKNGLSFVQACKALGVWVEA